MATNTPDANIPTLTPQPVAPGISQPTVNQLPPAPDPRDVAASSFMPHVATSVSGSSSKLSTITAALGYNRFLPATFNASTYVPSFLLFSLVLSEIDRIMMHTYRFYQSAPEWHPAMSQLYYGIIFIVHILRVQRTAQVISLDDNAFLDWFETNFPLSSLPIAGPLKHFLQSITTTQGYSKFYGNVYPIFPNRNWTGAGNAYYMPNNVELHRSFPPIPLLMDILNDMLTPRANFDSHSVAHWTNFYRQYTHVFGVASTQDVFGLCGIQNIGFLPPTTMPNWHVASHHFGYPPRLAAATTAQITTLAEFCRFGTAGTEHSLWFSRVVQVMQRHAQFMKDSTSIASIDTTGLGACLPIIHLSPNPELSLPAAAAGNQYIATFAAVAAVAAANNNAATPGHAAGFAVARINNLKITASSKFDNLHLLAEQFALLSCVNIDATALLPTGAGQINFPANANLRAGPIWDLPDVKSHTEINVLGQISAFLAGVFHSDTRLQK
jgi:hypothetical protein